MGTSTEQTLFTHIQCIYMSLLRGDQNYVSTCNQISMHWGLACGFRHMYHDCCVLTVGKRDVYLNFDWCNQTKYQHTLSWPRRCYHAGDSSEFILTRIPNHKDTYIWRYKFLNRVEYALNFEIKPIMLCIYYKAQIDGLYTKYSQAGKYLELLTFDSSLG